MELLAKCKAALQSVGAATAEPPGDHRRGGGAGTAAIQLQAVQEVVQVHQEQLEEQLQAHQQLEEQEEQLQEHQTVLRSRLQCLGGGGRNGRNGRRRVVGGAGDPIYCQPPSHT